MMQVQAPHNSTIHYLNEFKRIAKKLAGNTPAWLMQTRHDAMTKFSELGFPTQRQEAWKYMPLTALIKYPFNCEAILKPTIPDQQQLFASNNMHALIFYDGVFIKTLTSLNDLPKGVNISPLAMALAERDMDLKPYLSDFVSKAEHGFSLLNSAFMTDGVFIDIPKNTCIEKPIHIMHVMSGKNELAASHPRNLIIVGENSEVTIVESYVGVDESVYFTNAVSEIFINANAQVNYYKLQQESKASFHVGSTFVQQTRDSRFISHAISLGGKLVRSDINIALAAEGASCHLNGLYLAYGRQHVDLHTRIDHLKPHGTSRELYKGIIADQAKGVFNGQVYVHPQAYKSDANQFNRNLLLSSSAEIDTKPQLEIYNDDVKCTHGATVGQLEEEALFYFRSRGLDEQTTKTLLTFAFANEVMQNIENKTLQAHVRNCVMQYLPGGTGMQELL